MTNRAPADSEHDRAMPPHVRREGDLTADVELRREPLERLFVAAIVRSSIILRTSLLLLVRGTASPNTRFRCFALQKI
jgi:hypothetical protein